MKSDETAILIDAGISGKRILEGLEQTETPRDMVRAILVTHEHIDHVVVELAERDIALHPDDGEAGIAR